MKIVHLVTSNNVGGAQIMLQRYLSALGPRATDHSVISLVAGGAIADTIREMGVEVLDLGLRPGRVTPGAVFRLRKMLRDMAPDVVHGWMYHGCLAASAGLALSRQRRDTAIVWGIHHSLQDIAKEKKSTQMVLRAMSVLSQGVDLITYCSSNSQEQHEAIGFTPKASELIPNAVDTSVFRPDPEAAARLRDLCDIPEGRLIIGNVARSHPMKDHVSMVRATAQLLEMGHAVHAVILGEGHADGDAVAEAERLGIADHVSGIETRSDIERLVPGFDIFLLSSAWGEAFPLAVSEAMAAEVPCVVTDVGDCAYLVGNTGRVVPPSDPKKQALAIASLIDAGPEARAVLGESARNRVTEMFSTRIYIERHERSYARALKIAPTNGQNMQIDARPGQS